MSTCLMKLLVSIQGAVVLDFDGQIRLQDQSILRETHRSWFDSENEAMALDNRERRTSKVFEYMFRQGITAHD